MHIFRSVFIVGLCTLIGAVAFTCIGYHLHVFLPNIMTDATLEDDRGLNSLIDAYFLVGSAVGFAFGFLAAKQAISKHAVEFPPCKVGLLKRARKA